MKSKTNILNKFAKAESKYYKYLQRSAQYSAKMSNLLKQCIVENVLLQVHSFYVDYIISDGLALRFDCSGCDYVCDADKILQLYVDSGRKLTIDEIIEHTSS